MEIFYWIIFKVIVKEIDYKGNKRICLQFDYNDELIGMIKTVTAMNKIVSPIDNLGIKW